jgi:DNA-binding transcriptional MocR family regulator
MPEGVRWTTPGGGPTLWLEVPKRVSLDALGATLRDRGVSIESATNAFEGEPHLHGFRVSYAFLAPETLERAVRLVGEALGQALQAGVS